MKEWKEYRIQDIADFQKGFAFKSSDYSESGTRIIKVTNLNQKDYNNCAYIDNSEAPLYDKYRLAENDIIISTVGSWPTNPESVVGKVSRIPECISGSLLNQNAVRIKVRNGFCQNFLYYHLLTPAFAKYIVGTAQGSANQASITLDDIRHYSFLCPDYQEQVRLSSILQAIDDKIDLNNRINHNLEEQAQALYKSWFVDFDHFKGCGFVDSELGLIPKGWHVGTLSELGEIVAGGTPSKAKPEYYTNNGIAWLTPKDLSINCNKFTNKGEIDITEDGYKNCSAKLMPRGSVLFSSRAPIGYISIAKRDICTNQGFKSVVPTYAGTAYIYYWLRENTAAIEAQASGSTFKEASGSLMKSFPAIVPEKSVLDSFEKELSPILNEQELLEEEIYQAEQIRDSLLPRLMSGELVTNC